MKGRKPYRKYLILAVIAVLIIGIITVRAKHSGSAQPEAQTAVAKLGTVVSSVSGNGVLQAVTTVDVKSNVGGTVVELAVDEGDVVKAGQLIARIDPSDSKAAFDQANADFSSAKSQVDQARQALSMQKLQTSADIQGARQALESSKQKLLEAFQQAKVQPKLTLESIKQAESQLVSAQATLTQARSATVPQMKASAKASYDEARASYDKLDKNLKRQQVLLEKGFISQSTADDAEAQFASAKAQLESAKSKFDTVKDEAEQTLKDAEAKAAQAKSALETARANKVQDAVKQSELAAARADYKKAIASLASSQAASYQTEMKGEAILQARAQLQKTSASVDNARTQVGWTTILAPRSGVVVKKYVEKGSIVTAGRQAMAGSGSGVTIVEIADISRMQIVVNVDETDITKLSLRQSVDVSVEACPDELFAGKVVKIAPQAEVNSNVTTVPVTVELDHADRRLKPQMNATCDFVIDRKENVLCVPIEAISETDSGAEVGVLINGKQMARRVDIGLRGNDYCEIIRGLKNGDVCVLTSEDTSSSQSKSSRGPGGPPPF